MSYTPPLGNAVDFNETGDPYTPPAGNAVDFFEGEGLGPTLKFWDGASWVQAPLKWWNGTDWVNTGTLKYWDGASWVAT